MKSRTTNRMRMPMLTIVIVLLLGTSLPLWCQETGSVLNGVVKDASGAVIAGATVTITNKVTGRVFTTTTGMDGLYLARDLEPGHYSVRFEMTGFGPVEVADVNLLLGKTFKVDGPMQVAPVAQAVTVIATAPLIDLSSTTIGHNVTSEEFDRLPKARTFQGLLATSPSVNSGLNQFGDIVSVEGGFQVNGASSAENLFTIDGMPVTSLANGRMRQNAVFEFLQEVQVKTAGIEAEYGGSMGGVLSAVTKSGSNSLHGEAHYLFAGNGVSAGPIPRLLLDPVTERTASFVQDSKQADNRHDFGGSLGGYLLKDKMWFFAAAAPQWRRRSNDYLFSSGAERGTIQQDQFRQNLFGKLSFDPVTKIRTSFTWLYTPTVSTGRLPAYDFGPNTVTSSTASNEINKVVGFFQPQSSYTGSLDFLLTNRMILSVRGGRFWDDFKDTGIPGINSVEYRTPTSGLPADLQATIPTNQRGPVLFTNTPRLRNTYFDIVARTFVQADYGVFGHLWGDHDVKLGLGTMKNVNKVDNRYPGGGYVFVFWNSTFTGPGTFCTGATNPNRVAGLCRGTYGYYEVDDLGTRGSTGANMTNLYVQDKWRILPRLTLSLGVRFENEKIPSFRRDVKDFAFEFPFTDKIAPRLGFAYDLFGNGKAKVSFSWGRFYDWVKYELVRGTFGGDFWHIFYRSLDTPNAFSLSQANMPGRDLFSPGLTPFRDRRVPGFNTIIPGIKPMSTDLLNVGVDYQLNPQTVVSAHYVHNDLRRTIEDLGVINAAGDEEYFYGNPGEGGAQLNPLSGASKAPADLCRKRLSGSALDGCLKGLGFPMPKPIRTYDALELSVTRRFSRGWFASGSYVWSRLFGNYSGIAASEEIRPPTTGVSASAIQQAAGDITRQGGNANRAWDIDELLFDSHGKLNPTGRLPTDRPHVLKLYGSKTFRWGTELGAFFSASSGTPLTTYVNTINQTEVFVEGRGDMGRTPVLSQTDLIVAHEFNIREGKKLRVEWNFINLFNQKTSRYTYNWLNRGGGAARPSSGIDLSRVDLFAGYDYKALINNTVDGRNPNLGALDPRYGKDAIWNPGFASRLGIKFTF